MFESMQTRQPRYAARPHELHLIGYGGPERRQSDTSGWRWLSAALEEIDYGLLLISDAAEVSYANRAALAELASDHPLQLRGREMVASHHRDSGALAAALQAAAKRGLRKLLTLGEGEGRVAVSVVPIDSFQAAPMGQTGSLRPVLIMLGRRRVSGELSLQAFAQSHGLSPGETRVLQGLCRGLQPSEVARQHGVALSTVRTQIGSIRGKTGAASIRALVNQVAVLPPLMGVLRNFGAAELPSSAHAAQPVELSA